MKRITIDYILSLDPCYTRKELEVMFRGRKYVYPKTVLNEAKPEDAFWLLLRDDFLSEKDLRLFACDCAERVLPLFEEKYPNDNRPRKAIETGRLFAEGKATREELDAARAAAWAAARAARGAARAAWAAGAAARAAWDARAAARDAARDAERAWQVARLREMLT